MFKCDVGVGTRSECRIANAREVGRLMDRTWLRGCRREGDRVVGSLDGRREGDRCRRDGDRAVVWLDDRRIRCCRREGDRGVGCLDSRRDGDREVCWVTGNTSWLHSSRKVGRVMARMVLACLAGGEKATGRSIA